MYALYKHRFPTLVKHSKLSVESLMSGKRGMSVYVGVCISLGWSHVTVIMMIAFRIHIKTGWAVYCGVLMCSLTQMMNGNSHYVENLRLIFLV